MTLRKKTILVMVLALLLVAFTVAVAQTPAQGDQKTKTESCCAMESCCCNSGSCPLKAKDGAKSHADHKCCGDSCEMKHDGKSKSSCCKHKEKNKKA